MRKPHLEELEARVVLSADPINLIQPAVASAQVLTADAGGPYVTTEGQPITLTAADLGSGSVYYWDFNNDGAYDDASGRLVTFNPTDSGVYFVGLKVTNGDQFVTAATTVTATNVAPTLSFTPGASAGSYLIQVTDPSSVDMANQFFYQIDWDGDGIYDQSLYGASGTSVTHTFAGTQLQTVSVVATDKDGGVSNVKTVQSTATASYTIMGSKLTWYLTDGADAINFTSPSANTINVQETFLNGALASNNYQFTSITGIEVYANGGNDSINMLGMPGIFVTVHGGGGNDHIFSDAGDSVIDGGEGNDDIVSTRGNNNIDGAEGNDSLTTASGNDTIKGGEGNDVISAGDGNNYVDGAEGNDNIQTGGGNDALIGGTGIDTLNSSGGDDLLFGGTVGSPDSLKAIWNTWVTRPADRHTSIVNITKNVDPNDDGEADVLNPGIGFDVSYNDTTRSVTLSQWLSGTTWLVTNSGELSTALMNAKNGDLISIAAGTYFFTTVPRLLSGVTIMGQGIGVTTILGSLIIDNKGDYTPTVIKNLTLDHTGLASPIYFSGNGYNQFVNGTFYIDSIEVKGPGISNSPQFNFWSSAKVPTYGYIANSYIHDGSDDLISTWGGGAADPSIVEIYDTVATKAGPKDQDQIVTAHNGFRLVVVGGTLSNAVENIVASDGMTPMEIYFTVITPGARAAGVVMMGAGSIVDSATISTKSLIIYGQLINSTITAVTPYYPAFINVKQGGVVKGNHIINNAAPVYPGLKTVPARAVESNATIIDNVFENWGDVQADALAGTTGVSISGNTYL